MSPWRLAASLGVLWAQVDAAYPRRSTRSDGAIGDAAHAATGSASDHNPWLPDPRGSGGVVTALDLTHDPAHGLDGHELVAAITRARDPRVKYLIFDHKMTRSYAHGPYRAWEAAPYTGVSPHTEHVHVSVSTKPSLYDDPSPWALPGGDDMTPDQVRDVVRDVLRAELPGLVRAAVLGATYREYVDENGDGRRETRRVADVLFSTHAHVVSIDQRLSGQHTT